MFDRPTSSLLACLYVGKSNCMQDMYAAMFHYEIVPKLFQNSSETAPKLLRNCWERTASNINGSLKRPSLFFLSEYLLIILTSFKYFYFPVQLYNFIFKMAKKILLILQKNWRLENDRAMQALSDIVRDFPSKRETYSAVCMFNKNEKHRLSKYVWC